MAGRVEGKIALVAGGGPTPGETVGNGRATAVVLAGEGAKVIVADRDLTRAEDTVAFIRGERNQASAVQCDITQEPEVQAMVAHVLQVHGRLDILHNNVGASLARSTSRSKRSSAASTSTSKACGLPASTPSPRCEKPRAPSSTSPPWPRSGPIRWSATRP